MLSDGKVPGFQSFKVSRKGHRETLKLETCPLSLLPAAYFKVETDHSVLVAQRHDRNVPRHVVLHLDDLLVGNGDVGAVGEGDIARHLLLDGDLRPSNHGGFTGQALGIDLDAAGSEQTLQAAVDGAVESLIDEQVGGLSAEPKGTARRRGRRTLPGCGPAPRAR